MVFFSPLFFFSIIQAQVASLEYNHSLCFTFPFSCDYFGFLQSGQFLLLHSNFPSSNLITTLSLTFKPDHRLHHHSLTSTTTMAATHWHLSPTSHPTIFMVAHAIDFLLVVVPVMFITTFIYLKSIAPQATSPRTPLCISNGTTQSNHHDNAANHPQPYQSHASISTTNPHISLHTTNQLHHYSSFAFSLHLTSPLSLL